MLYSLTIESLSYVVRSSIDWLLGLNTLRLKSEPIQFGTDGWRGILGVDFTVDRLLPVAAASAQELKYRAPKELQSNTVIIGYDRRFLAPEFAVAVAAAIRGCNLEPLLTESPVPTPACSWATVKRKTLGAIVITASHNPPEWIGLKIKGPDGASVDRAFTSAVERRLSLGVFTEPIEGPINRFDARKEHLDGLREKFDVQALVAGLKKIGLKVIVDPMHGSAAGCISELLGENEDISNLVEEIRVSRDPLFGGNSPEPLAKNLSTLIAKIKHLNSKGIKSLGLVFDGDGDRIAAIDENGRFCSTQLLMPLLIEHLARVRGLPGSVVKTVSGSDLMKLVAEDIGRKVVELPVGFKYIAQEMNNREVLVGGEESGGIGFGMHIPERDALFAALLVLEALKDAGQGLGSRLKEIENHFGESHYDRIDIDLVNMETRERFERFLSESPPRIVNQISVLEVISIDGVKLRLGENHWLMFRFSGTEPLLRIYCEAPSEEKLQSTLKWAKELAEIK